MAAAGAWDANHQGVCTVRFDDHDIITDDLLLPSQLSRHQDQWCGERRLMAAVLIDAIACLRSWSPEMVRADNHPTREQLEWIEARRWIQSRDDRDVFSFSRICAELNLPAERTRAALLHETRASQSERASYTARTPARPIPEA